MFCHYYDHFEVIIFYLKLYPIHQIEIEIIKEFTLDHNLTYLLSTGFTNLLTFTPFKRPAPNPLILPLPIVPTV